MKMRLPILVLTAGTLLLAGCGSGDSDASASPEPSVDPMAALSGTYKGTFTNVPKPPSGSPDVTGTVEMEVSSSGTKLTLAAEGLDPDTVYVAHIHDDACSAEEPGGAHFKFDAEGESAPPNEIHIATIKVDKDKKGTGETTNPKAVNSHARSVVIHVKRAKGEKKDADKPPKLACADLVKK